MVEDLYIIYPYWKIFDSNIIQLLRDPAGPHNVHQLGLVEPDLVQVGRGQVSRANNLLLE